MYGKNQNKQKLRECELIPMTAIPKKMLHLHLEQAQYIISSIEAQKIEKLSRESRLCLAPPNTHTHIFLERSKKCEILIIIGSVARRKRTKKSIGNETSDIPSENACKACFTKLPIFWKRTVHSHIRGQFYRRWATFTPAFWRAPFCHKGSTSKQPRQVAQECRKVHWAKAQTELLNA